MHLPTSLEMSLPERQGYDSSANSLDIVAITNKSYYVALSRRLDYNHVCIDRHSLHDCTSKWTVT